MTEPGAVEIRRFELDGRTVTLRSAGHGVDLVALHGLAGSWRWWSPLVERLASSCSVHLVDLPRLGRLRGEELAVWLGRLLDAAGLGPVHLAGHSLGGLVAAELAALQPGRVRRLVLVAPAGVPCERSAFTRVGALLAELRALRLHVGMIAGDAVRTGPASLTHGIAYVWDRDLRAELAGVRAPTLLVWGERDRLVPPRLADDWQRLLPGSRLVWLPCGHVPMWESPRELGSRILAFLDDKAPDDVGNEIRLRKGDGVGFTGDDHESSVR